MRGACRASRDIIDPAYAILTKVIFASIERIAGADPKHGERLRLENYLLYNFVIGKFAAKNPVLDYFVQMAGASKEHAVRVMGCSDTNSNHIF